MQKEIKVYLKKKKGAFPVEYLIKKKVLKDTEAYLGIAGLCVSSIMSDVLILIRLNSPRLYITKIFERISEKKKK